MRKLLRLLLWTALVIGALIGLARLVALRWWRIPTDDPVLEASVAPTLRGGDLVILWRLTPARFGDLVLCPEPEAEGRIVIARIAGENGDHVSVKGSTVSVNGKRAATERACAQFSVSDPNTDKDVKQHCQIEVLGSVAHMRGSADGHKQQPLDVARDVPDGSIFLLSDNRLYPFDSRDYGSVERATCQESIVFRLVSGEGFFDVDNRFTFIQ